MADSGVVGVSVAVENLKLNDSQRDATVPIGVIQDSIGSWGFPMDELYKISLKFYKEKLGKAIQIGYDERLKLVALTQQVIHGKCDINSQSPLGVLDVIGKDRRQAWLSLADMPAEDAMKQFVLLLNEKCPSLKPYIEAHKADVEEKERLRLAEDAVNRLKSEQTKLEEDERIREENERYQQELRRRQIQEALNQQTFQQFKAYAEKQYAGNPDQQAILIRELQDQHYQKYIQQVYQEQLKFQPSPVAPPQELTMVPNGDTNLQQEPLLPNGKVKNIVQRESVETSEEGSESNSDDMDEEDLNSSNGDRDKAPVGNFEMALPSMWTRQDISEFKENIKKDGGQSVIKVGHGETVTVRVPTHDDGTCLFWEFATDSYDIGFGLLFEWSKCTDSEVSVHVSESSEEEEDEALASGDDIEGGAHADTPVRSHSNRPPTTEVIPIFRRDCHQDVYAGSHIYPGQGVYLLKFDNSYSMWRAKTLYYRVYYTR